MSAAVSTLVRVFKMGATVLRDIDPSMPPEDVLRAHSINHPFLAHAEIEPPVVEDGRLVFNIRKPAAQTKGAAKPRSRKAARKEAGEADALAAIEAWAAGGDMAASGRVQAVFDVALAALKRRVPVDPFLVPMA